MEMVFGLFVEMVARVFDRIKGLTLGLFEKYIWNPIKEHYKVTISVMFLMLMIPFLVRLLM